MNERVFRFFLPISVAYDRLFLFFPLQETKLLSNRDSHVLLVITMAVAAMGALFNTTVILAIIIDPLKTLRKGAWITILNLAIADLISCVSCFCLRGRAFFKTMYRRLISGIFNFGFGFGVSGSFLLLTFLTVQIYLLTKYPLKSRFMLTDLKIVVATILAWVLAFVLGLSRIAYLHLSGDASFQLYLAQIGVLELALFIQIILNLQVSVEIMKSGRSAGNDSCRNKKHRNMAKTVIILTLILFLTAFPYFVFKQIEFIVRLGHFGQSKSVKILRYVSYFYAPIMILNFTANPILYSLRLPDYKRTLLALVCKGTGDGQSKTTPTTSLKSTNAFSMHRGSEASSSQRSTRYSSTTTQ